MTISEYSIYGLSAKDKFTAPDEALKAYVRNGEHSEELKYAHNITNLFIMRDHEEREAMREAERAASLYELEEKD